MIGKRQGLQRPTVLGTLIQASTYGATIPTIYGTTQSPLLVIWANNLRLGYSTKKNKKKGIQTYMEAIDFLVGSNPIGGILQVWNNTAKGPLNFVKLDFTFNNITGARTITIPDASFYYLIAVTMDIENKGSFFDYGSNAPTAYDNTSEFPLYNAWQNGPGVTDVTQARRWPFIYKWNPNTDGATVTFPSIDLSLVAAPPNLGEIPGWNNFLIHFYYAQIPAGTRAPMVINRLAFEPTLGSGSEYSGFTSQQIQYPEYAGVGSPDVDCGAAAAIPSLKPEVSGSFSRFAPRGDADFCDMIEDTLKSGVIQVGAQLGLIQRGVNLNELPGAIDKMVARSAFTGGETEAFWSGFQNAIAKGQILFAMSLWLGPTSGITNLTISDDAGNTWIPLFTNLLTGMWYAVASANWPAGNQIRIHTADAPSGNDWMRARAWISDLGPYTVNAVASTNGTTAGSPIAQTVSCSITVTAPCIIYVGVMTHAGWGNFANSYTLPPLWKDLFPAGVQAVNIGPNNSADNNTLAAYRIVAAPGTYAFPISLFEASQYSINMVALAYTQPGQIPKTLGDIIDRASLDLCRVQCQANGLWGSVAMTSQKSASDWLKEFGTCANLAYVWSGFTLKFIPRSEVSTVGNGMVYTAPTASGPVATLRESDLIGDSSGPLVDIQRKAQVDSNNIMQVQFFDRNSDYAQSTASEPVTGAIALFGPRKEAPIVLPEIQDPSVARKILAVEVRRTVLLRNLYKFTMKANWLALEAMDLILINDSKVGITNLPVRLTSITENDTYELDCEAEPFLYGCNAPTTLAVTAAVPYDSGAGASPGSVNTPIFFEPSTRMLAQQNQAQVWIIVSGGSQAYGGCIVELSTDGGASYNPVGTIVGNGVTGFTVGDWPIANDPDTTNDLSVDLTESLGTLTNRAVVDEDNFVYPCIVMPGLTCIPYELMAYGVATLTAANKYTLKATGGGTNHLRRAVFSCPQPTAGVDHPNNSRFAFIGAAGAGIFKLNLDPLWIGQAIFFKFLAVNTLNLNQQDPSAATAYSYTPTGCPASAQNPNNSYVNTPAIDLSQTTATNVAMAQTSVQFPSNKANYNARNFTIPDPGGTPTVYYVTIHDPAQLGDVGTGTALTAQCQTSNALVGAPGYTYMGFIQATHLITDPLNVQGPGGNPPPQNFLVGP